MKLSQFAPEFRHWVDHSFNLEENTRTYYNGGVGMLLRTHLAQVQLEKISSHLCETVSFPGGNGNANRALRTLRRMLHKAEELGHIQKVPRIAIRKEWGRSVAMSRADAAKIASYMKGDPKDAFLILRSTGMRPCEVFALRWEFVDFSRSVYCNPRGKTASARRTIPLLDESLSILQRRHADHGYPREGWVFRSFSFTGHIHSIQEAYKKAREAAGLPKAMCLYTARHGYGTEIGAIVSLRGIMDLMGHSSATTALRYQHPTTEDLVAKLAQSRFLPMVAENSSTPLRSCKELSRSTNSVACQESWSRPEFVEVAAPPAV